MENKCSFSAKGRKPRKTFRKGWFRGIFLRSFGVFPGVDESAFCPSSGQRGSGHGKGGDATDREKLRREAVRQLRRMASGAPVEELRITQREDGSPELELAGIDPYQLSGVKLGKNGVELSFYSRLEAIDRLLELAGPGGDNLLEELGLSGWNGGKDE